MNGEEPTSPIAERPMADLGGKTRPRRRWRRLALAAVIVALVGAGLLFAAYRYNNHPRTSDAALAEGLALAIERGQGWVQQHPDMLLRQTRNVALFYMLQDMDRLNPTQLYGRLVAEFLDAPASPGFWKRMLDPDRRVWAGPMNHALTEANLDNRWLIFALNPDGVKLNPAQETSLFDPERWENRRLAHQLWALYHLRRVSADPRATDELIDRLCRRIAEENALDIRVNDLYCERVAFLLMAGRPEMVHRRWVERLIKNQREDGGWRDPWNRLGSTWRWGKNPESNEHTTLLALWALYRIKYACPEAFGLAADT